MADGAVETKRASRLLVTFPVLAVLSVAVFVLDLPGAPLVYPVAGLAAIVGLVRGVRIHRPSPVGPWRWFIASAVTTIGNQIVYVAVGAPTTGVGVILFGLGSLAGMVFEIVGLFGFIRKRLPGGVLGVVLDGSVLALSFWLVMLPTVVQPVLALSSSAPATIIQSLYFPLDAALVFGAAMLVLCDRGRVLAVLVLTATLTMQLVGDVVYGLQEAQRIPATGITDVCYVLSLFALGLVALHPSMKRLSNPQTRLRSREGVGRVWVLAPLFVAGVEAAVILAPRTTGARIAIGVTLVVLTGTLLARVNHTVRANASAQQALLISARHDPLTGLPNRSLAEERLTETANSGWRPSTNVGVMIVNVDRLERVNDTFGHDAGDELLREVARRVETVAPKEAVVARIAGDEFCIGLPSVDDELAATTLATSILASFDEPFSISVGKVFTTVSVGVAVAPLKAIRATTELFRDADTALRRAKDAGQSNLVLYDCSMRDQARHRLELENALRTAVANQEFLLHHQPIVDVRTGLVTGFEALVRWMRPGHGLVSPVEFIPIAEETGLISPLGTWVMQQGLVELRDWIDRRACSPYARMSINASARQLRDHDFVTIVDDALRSANLPASQLWVEITETAILADMDASLDTVRRLRALGVRIALDDFGTGYSSLSHLRKFPIDRIKIDRSFVSSLETNADDRSLVGSILVLARELGKDVVAEGVETAEQLAILARLGCPKAQGYLFSRPLPAEELLAKLPAIEQTPTAVTTH